MQAVLQRNEIKHTLCQTDSFYFCFIKYSFICCFSGECKCNVKAAWNDLLPFPLRVHQFSGCYKTGLHQNSSRKGVRYDGTKTCQESSPSSWGSSKAIIQKVNMKNSAISGRNIQLISVLSGQCQGKAPLSYKTGTQTAGRFDSLPIRTKIYDSW